MTGGEAASYLPVPLEFHTFDRKVKLQRQKSHPVLGKVDKLLKDNGIPGPGSYQTINHWPGKGGLKRSESNFLNHLSYGPTARVYH